MKKYIVLILMALSFAACSGDMPVSNPSVETGKGDKLSLEVGLCFPESKMASSRALGDTPDYGGLNLFLLVFTGDETSDRANNYLTEVVKATRNSIDGAVVSFTASPSQTDASRIIHLVATGAENLNVAYGPENVVIPSLVTTSGQDAYWQRIFTPAINKENKVQVANALGASNPVPMLRNFAKVSVTNNAGNFTLTGFAVINTLDRGFVAPYSPTTGFVSFLDANGNPLSYAEVSNTDYQGMLPPDWNLNTDIPADIIDSDAKYFYERPFTSINRTYVIVAGQYNNESVSYYKLDLGSTDDSGLFSYYNLFRNFDYHITINSVSASGAPTSREAAEGAVYNNFSAAVETISMLNISDGNDIMYVNFTRHVLTSETESIKLRYRYVENIAGNSGTVNNGLVETSQAIAAAGGSVISSVDVGSVDDEDGWRTITITPKTPTDEVTQQSFTLYRTNGLSRTITFISRKPWSIRNIQTFNGTDNERPDRIPQNIDPTLGAPLTIFFDLPAGLPEAMFPLRFQLEADRQNIENNPIGTLVVSSGQSLFPGIVDTRISYIKTVSWAEYNYLTDENNVLTTKDNVNHTVRCRFLCTTSLETLNLPQTVTRVKINNPYFVESETSFTRVRGTN